MGGGVGVLLIAEDETAETTVVLSSEETEFAFAYWALDHVLVGLKLRLWDPTDHRCSR